MSQKQNKAYENLDFLRSRDARGIRILCEYLEPLQQFQRMGVRETIVIFGSARAKPAETLEAEFQKLNAEKKNLAISYAGKKKCYFCSSRESQLPELRSKIWRKFSSFVAILPSTVFFVRGRTRFGTLRETNFAEKKHCAKQLDESVHAHLLARIR